MLDELAPSPVQARLAAPAMDEGRRQRAMPVVDAWLAMLTGYPSPERAFALVDALAVFASSEVAGIMAALAESCAEAETWKGHVERLLAAIAANVVGKDYGCGECAPDNDGGEERTWRCAVHAARLALSPVCEDGIGGPP